MIQFRDIHTSDLAQLMEWRMSPEITQFMYGDPQLTMEGQIKWLNKIQNTSNSVYKIIEYKGKAVGQISVTNIDFESKKGVWGIYVGDSKSRARGVGAIATYLFLEQYVFGELNLNKFQSEVLDFNKEAIKLNESLGFRREAYYRDHCYKNGEYYDMVGFALLKRDWDKVKVYYKNKLKL